MNDELQKFFHKAGKKSWSARKKRGTDILVSKAGRVSWEKKTAREKKLQIEKMQEALRLKRELNKQYARSNNKDSSQEAE